MKKVITFFWAAGLLVLLPACGVKQPIFDEGVAKHTGSIAVFSDVPDALIFLDEEATEYTTPDTVNFVPPGEHTIRLYKDGYSVSPDKIQLNVPADSVIRVDFYLSQILNTGKVIIESEPEAAEIILDGINTGLVTPDTLVVEARDHTLALRKNGFMEEDLGSIRVGTNQQLQVQSTLAVQKRVLLESFANTSCLPCTTTNRYLYNLEQSRNEEEYVLVEYFTNWPNVSDPFYQHNPNGSRARFMNFYKISTVPGLFIMGEAVDPLDEALINQNFVNELATMRDDIGISLERHFSDIVHVEVDIFVNGTIPDGDIRLMVGIIENDFHFSEPPGSNGLKDFSNVFRQFLTADTGNPLNLQSGQQRYHFGVPMRTEWDPEKLTVIAFLQEWNSKQVLQAAKY